ncbi:hypothetical protein B0H14DRAFT_3465950 [Mycena olivaceomarginata]|nr:hypothetical protein B0H14DRAFT_3465950 [Mycena olivaceomarginata]
MYYSCAVSFQFLDVLVDVLADLEAIPEDNGILEDEWEDDDYPEIESIKPGTSGKELLIVLPRDEWFLRAVQWVQALDLLKWCLHELEEATGSDNGHSDESSEDE